jgi:hypothetical protein
VFIDGISEKETVWEIILHRRTEAEEKAKRK